MRRREPRRSLNTTATEHKFSPAILSIRARAPFGASSFNQASARPLSQALKVLPATCALPAGFFGGKGGLGPPAAGGGDVPRAGARLSSPICTLRRLPPN